MNVFNQQRLSFAEMVWATVWFGNKNYMIKLITSEQLAVNEIILNAINIST